MTKIFKSNFFFASLVLALAVFVSITTNASAMTTSVSGSSDSTMNPPALGVLPLGCDLGVGTVFSPETGESCSVKGTTITPPIVMMPPFDMYGCKMGSPYSMTTGNKCVPKTSVDGTGVVCPTGVNCTGGVKPVDCTVAKNSACANRDDSRKETEIDHDNNICIDGTIKTVDSTTGKPSCTINVGGVIKTMPPLVMPMRVSSTDDMKIVQKALNSALKDKLSTSISTDGKHGPKTRSAIKMFQKSVGLKADGFIGPKTLEKLKASFQ